MHTNRYNKHIQFELDLSLVQVYPEGTHFMIPWFERPIIYDVRARPNLVESTSGSRDLQMVNLHIGFSPMLTFTMYNTFHFYLIYGFSKMFNMVAFVLL
jgi:hypothetical protein